jgi:uncharacterized protein YoxC
MLKEFKRDAVRKELDQLSEQLAQKKQLLPEIQEKEERAQQLVKKSEELGVTVEEVQFIDHFGKFCAI